MTPTPALARSVPKVCRRHFGVLVTRTATSNEFATGVSWGVKHPETITHNVCRLCGATI
jgi:hypothetical protein